MRPYNLPSWLAIVKLKFIIAMCQNGLSDQHEVQLKYI